MVEGKAEGMVEKSREIAMQLLNEDLPLDLIVRATNLTIDDIKKIKELRQK